MKDFVIIPAYNEGEKISAVIKEVKKHAQRIIVVDDGSQDDTAARAAQEKVIVLKHKVNLGKGAALRTGCDYALELGADRLVVIDADGQHMPEQIPQFINALQDYEIIFGYRKRSATMPLVLRFGNNFINNTLKLMIGIDVHDSQCGYRSFTAAAYRNVRWKATDYYMETEMIIKAARHRLQYSQIPIETIYVDKYKGTTVFDGVKIVAKMISQGVFP
ncbi:MAG: glycosyltransferase family 2 protein [Nanoarchaeota archaeon]|nr:glycosyltransferase family 2 protein [Nanoarchaeota archaeon]